MNCNILPKMSLPISSESQAERTKRIAEYATSVGSTKLAEYSKKNSGNGRLVDALNAGNISYASSLLDEMYKTNEKVSISTIELAVDKEMNGITDKIFRLGLQEDLPKEKKVVQSDTLNSIVGTNSTPEGTGTVGLVSSMVSREINVNSYKIPEGTKSINVGLVPGSQSGVASGASMQVFIPTAILEPSPIGWSVETDGRTSEAKTYTCRSGCADYKQNDELLRAPQNTGMKAETPSKEAKSAGQNKESEMTLTARALLESGFVKSDGAIEFLLKIASKELSGYSVDRTTTGVGKTMRTIQAQKNIDALIALAENADLAAFGTLTNLGWIPDRKFLKKITSYQNSQSANARLMVSILIETKNITPTVENLVQLLEFDHDLFWRLSFEASTDIIFSALNLKPDLGILRKIVALGGEVPSWFNFSDNYGAAPNMYLGFLRKRDPDWKEIAERKWYELVPILIKRHGAPDPKIFPTPNDDQVALLKRIDLYRFE